MIWLLPIFFNLLLPLAAATVTGQVEPVNSREAGRTKNPDRSGTVVWLEPASASAPIPLAGNRVAVIDQKDKRFLPHVLAVQVGAAVDFPNSDPVFHNAFSTFDGQIFDIGLYPPGKSRRVVFRRPGEVRVFCNIHPMMSAVILVVPTPWFGVTARDGSFTIADVPAGEYEMHVFHERAAPGTLKKLSRKLEIAGDRLQLPLLRISEEGYVQGSHKNKHGKEYPPVPDDFQVYPGGKQ